MAKTNNPCTLCGKPGIPGLIQGAGKCQYHWNVGAFGKESADRAAGIPAPSVPVPTGYTAEELDRDNPFNQWLQESNHAHEN